MDSIMNVSVSEAELETGGDIDKKPLKTIPEGDITSDDIIINQQTEEKSNVQESKEEVTRM